MQFITKGPDIPDSLLQEHEEGRVVFFCGAGISHPAGLPDFKKLVEQSYQLNGTTFSEIEYEAFKSGQFDTTLNRLETRLPGQRLAVRRPLLQILKPDLQRKGATDTQVALLSLARTRNGTLQLVTTNYDRLFHEAAKRTNQTFQAYSAPMVPIPQNNHWNGLVYLHGLLPENEDDLALNQLVMTSSDFGSAYLQEGWAARFVNKLFHNYGVCFIGYSISDPILRYMMDALAAARRLGETNRPVWALCACEPGQEKQKTIEWEAKGVMPILYGISADGRDHSALHRTLHVWADIYRDGVLGKQAIVAQHAFARPQNSTQQDNFVGRMLWALSDKSGLPAKQFADYNPVPSLEWLLGPFTAMYFKHDDLSRFGVSECDKFDSNLRFSLINRPTSYKYALPMLLVSGSVIDSEWDNVMFHLARWLIRHLDDPRLIIWISEQGGRLHNSWSSLIEHELDRLASLGSNNKLTAMMRTLWRLLLSGRVKSLSHNANLSRWKDRLKWEGLTTTLRWELRKLLTPLVSLKKPFYGYDNVSTGKAISIKQLVDWKIVLAADRVYSTLFDQVDDHWASALPHLLEDFQQLLRDALDLLRELGEADDRRDRTNWDLPSIAPHRQNDRFNEWMSLIELLRDAWLKIYVSDSARAVRIAQDWFEVPYPTFKRLALFAASHNDCIPAEQWAEWLLADNAWWLWSLEMRREVCRLLVLQGQQLAGKEQERLESAILAGPPREISREDLEPAHWQGFAGRTIWLYLAKLSASGLTLGASAAVRLMEISKDHPKWRLASDESDEFSCWADDINDSDSEYELVGVDDIDVALRKRQDLVQWLKKPQLEQGAFYQEIWHHVCRKHMLNSLCALNDLARDGIWPTERWRDALQIWSEESMVKRSWHYAAPLVFTMPDTTLQEIAHSVTWWLKAASNAIVCHKDIFLNLCDRVLALPLETDTGMIIDNEPLDQPVIEAINHPIGHITQALLNLWLKCRPNDGEPIPDDIKPFFTKICDMQVGRFRHGRVLLGASLIALFRLDRAWTEQYLLPLFNWSNSAEAKGVWQGFLGSPRLYQPLFIAFKAQFLECANYYADLGRYRREFATFLTYAALAAIEGYTIDELRSAFSALPQEGLENCAQALCQVIESVAKQREDYWKNRVQPFLKQVWPKSLNLATPRMVESLSRLVIASRGEFPAALAEMEGWLQPLEEPNYVVHLLLGSDLCKCFPTQALLLLDTVISEQSRLPQEMGQCLDDIAQADPNLAQDFRYLRLREYPCRRGM